MYPRNRCKPFFLHVVGRGAASFDWGCSNFTKLMKSQHRKQWSVWGSSTSDTDGQDRCGSSWRNKGSNQAQDESAITAGRSPRRIGIKFADTEHAQCQRDNCVLNMCHEVRQRMAECPHRITKNVQGLRTAEQTRSAHSQRCAGNTPLSIRFPTS